MTPINESAAVRARERDCAVCPLSRVKAGVEVRIKRLCASPEVAARLREIGFGEEQIIKLITSQANFICLVCNARKSNRLPHEAGMRLIRKPKRPKWRPFVHISLPQTADTSWKHFLDLSYWNVELGQD